MPYFNLPAQLNDNELGEIKACLNKISSQTRWCVTLTPKERRRLFKMGDKSLAFVENSLTAARNHPEALAACFDVDEFERVVHRAAALHELRLEVNKLAMALNDTTMVVRAEALQQSCAVYERIKIAADRLPGFRAVAAQLGRRFARPSRKEKSDASMDEPARVGIEVQTINHEPQMIPIQAEPVAGGAESLDDAPGHINDAARSVDGECERLSDEAGRLNDAARSVGRECGRLNDESGSLNDEAPPLNREDPELGDDSFRCRRESSELNAECASLDEEAGSCSDECRRDNDEPRSPDHEFRRPTDGLRSRCGNERRARLRRSDFRGTHLA